MNRAAGALLPAAALFGLCGACGAQKSRLVVAHLMHQESIGAEDGPGEGPFAAAPTQPGGVLAGHPPEALAHYRQPEAAARHDVALARAAGIDAFAMILTETHLPRSQFARTIEAYWRACADGGLRIYPEIWGGLETPEKAARLAAGIKTLAAFPDAAWMRYRGRRVVGVTGGALAYPEFVKTVLAPLGGRDAVFLVLVCPHGLKERQEKTPAYVAGADAVTVWPNLDYGKAIAAIPEDAARAGKLGKEFWHPAMPAFAQSRPTPGIRPHVREKLGMVSYLEDWRRAVDADALVVYLATWNDLTEDSAVMPETNHGRAFYDLTTALADAFHRGGAPTVLQERILLFHHPQVVERLALPPGRQPMGALPGLDTTPPTDHIGLTALLREPATVEVHTGERRLAAREFGAGMSSWLLYHPSGAGGRRAVYPTPRAGLAVTVLPRAFVDTQVYLFVRRGGRRVGVFRSHRPIAGAAARGEMTTVGDAFLLDTKE